MLNDAVYCFACRHFSINTIGGQDYNNRVFINHGFNCWKKQSISLKKHSNSENHKSSIEKWTLFLSTKKNENCVSNLLIHSRMQEIKDNRNHVYFLLKATLYLAKQGLAFRGNNEGSESLNRGNFIELLETFGDDKTKLKMQSRYGHYTSHEYQNDLIGVIASSTKNIILNNMSHLGAFAILVDETKDASKKEQLSFLIRFIDKNYNIQEKALGCYHMKKCDALSLSDAILKIIRENKLDIKKCVAQCYDGASVMSGSFTGVQKRIADIIPQAVYIHCYAHRLNLCLLNSIQDISAVVNFFDTVQGVYTYIMNGHTRYELFIQIQKDKKIKVLHLERLVETRWSYWYSSIQKIKMRYSEIKEVLTILTLQGDQTARAYGLLEEISTFQFIMILNTMKKILKRINCLSCELQSTSIFLPEAMNLVESTKKDLQNFRSENMYFQIHDKSKLFAKKNGIVDDELKKERLKRNLTISKNLDDYFVNSTLGKSQKTNTTQTLKSEVFYATVDRYMNIYLLFNVM